ncbi:MAG TPA: hypothetical protein VHW00_21080 [Thermoanaerobaculia bacterium]|nr:hypothetical protein [Thermoanaerobaculia bacterium]
MRMRLSSSFAVLVLLFASLPAFASPPGWVFVVNKTPDGAVDNWLTDGHGEAAGTAWELLYHPVPFLDGGQFLLPGQNRHVFHFERTVSMWDGVPRVFTEPGKGYDELFTVETELGEIAPKGHSRFLVAERWNTRERGAHLIEFDANGRIREIRFPELIDPETNRAVGATHLELLRDRCTLLYTADSNRVLRMNLCTGAALSDFATFDAGTTAGAIRALPNNDVLIANADLIHRFDASGALLRTYLMPGVSHIALSLDGASFYAAGVSDGEGVLRRFDLSIAASESVTVQLGRPGHAYPATETVALVVVNEWRAANADPGKTRSVGRH